MSTSRFLGALVLVAGVGLLVWAGVRDNQATVDAGSPPDDEVAVSTVSPPDVEVTLPPEPTIAADPIPVLGEARTLANIDGWLNTDASSFETARGDVTIVQFWTFGCFNCKNTLPYLKEIYAEHHADGLEIIGVHSPEFDYEADAGNVAAAVADLGITWPVALDTSRTNFRSWQEGGRRYWPRTFVVDSDGAIRFDRIGEGAYEQLEETVARLLTGGSGAS